MSTSVLHSIGLDTTSVNNQKETGAALSSQSERNNIDSLNNKLSAFEADFKNNPDSVSLSDLLALLSQIIEASQKLYSQMMMNRISQAVATSKLATELAQSKCDAAKLKFGITLGASLLNMGLTTFATVRMGKTRALKDKHLQGDMKVENLSSKDLTKHSAKLQQQRTAKYNSVVQMGNASNQMVGNMNDIQNANQVKDQEESQANKELKQKFDAQIDQYIQDLSSASKKLNEILEVTVKTGLATNR